MSWDSTVGHTLKRCELRNWHVCTAESFQKWMKERNILDQEFPSHRPFKFPNVK